MTDKIYARFVFSGRDGWTVAMNQEFFQIMVDQLKTSDSTKHFAEVLEKGMEMAGQLETPVCDSIG